MDKKVSVKHWDVSPFLGVGPLTFGLSRDEVRSLLGEDVSTFKKGPYASVDTDAYESLGLHLHYDNDERLECIEFVGPVRIFFRGISLMNVPVKDVLANLDRAEVTYRYDDGYFIDDYGIALYAPADIVSAVTIFRKGYYNSVV